MSDYELNFNFEPDKREILEICSQVVAENAVSRIANNELEELHMFVPAMLMFHLKSDNSKTFDKVQDEMIADRGGTTAVPLYDSGNLLMSLDPAQINLDFGIDSVGISSNLTYAHKQQFGGEYEIEIQDEWESRYGVIFERGQKVNITPRPFAQFGTRELLQVQEEITNLYKKRGK